MTSLLVLCLLTPVMFMTFVMVGIALQQQAAHFILEQEGYTPAKWSYSGVVTVLFALIASLIFIRAEYQSLPMLTVFRDLILLGWCVVLTHLDIARHWLPLSFTLNLTLSGLLFTLLSDTLMPLRHALMDGGVMMVLLSGFRVMANRQGSERFGLGDVYLLAGLSVWLTLPVTATLTLMALGLIAVQWLASRAGLLVNRQELPFAPYICFCLAMTLLAGIPSFTGHEL
jgi:general secretion pathway protein O